MSTYYIIHISRLKARTQTYIYIYIDDRIGYRIYKTRYKLFLLSLIEKSSASFAVALSRCSYRTPKIVFMEIDINKLG